MWTRISCFLRDDQADYQPEPASPSPWRKIARLFLIAILIGFWAGAVAALAIQSIICGLVAP